MSDLWGRSGKVIKRLSEGCIVDTRFLERSGMMLKIPFMVFGAYACKVRLGLFVQ